MRQVTAMNKVILMGNVGSDPKLRYAEKRAIASFSLATNEPARRRPDGSEIPPRTEWHNIVITDEPAEFAEKYVRKGSRLLVEGTLRTRYWEDQNAIKRAVTEIYVTQFEILSGPRNG